MSTIYQMINEMTNYQDNCKQQYLSNTNKTKSHMATMFTIALMCLYLSQQFNYITVIVLIGL